MFIKKFLALTFVLLYGFDFFFECLYFDCHCCPARNLGLADCLDLDLQSCLASFPFPMSPPDRSSGIGILSCSDNRSLPESLLSNFCFVLYVSLSVLLLAQSILK